jgi:hypothetical protein
MHLPPQIVFSDREVSVDWMLTFCRVVYDEKSGVAMGPGMV